MRILYIAKHDQPHGNDDEGAIHDALIKLGHTVGRVRESAGHNAWKISKKYDFCLMHHWHNFADIKKIRCPKVFWCFDLIDFPDQSIAARCAQRRTWITDLTSICDLGFCTDGDWVANDRSGKLNWLMQGADQRYLLPQIRQLTVQDKGNGSAMTNASPLLFTGISRGGALRVSFVAEMIRRYGAKFVHYEGRKHGNVLAELIQRAKIMLAPDAPITNQYWSNRIYLTLGYGGFLLHPYCYGLFKQYEGNEVVYYRSRAELHDLIAYYWERPDLRQKIAQAGVSRTIRDHTYVNRCAELCCIVKERLKIG